MGIAAHKYLPLFIAEARESLSLLAGELVRIEQEPPGGPLWDAVFRRVHSVKGSAATVGIPDIVEIAHEAEALIGKLKAQKATPGRREIDLLLEATDALVKLVKRTEDELEKQKALEIPAELPARLRAAAKSVPSEPPPAAKPAGAPAGATQPGAPAGPAAAATAASPAGAAAVPGAQPDPAVPRVEVVISLSKACQAPGARALIVQRKLKALGTLLELEPLPAQLMQKKGAVRIVALLATARPLDEVRAAFGGVPEVETVEARPVAQAQEQEQRAQPPAAAALASQPLRPDAPQEDSRQGPTVRVRAEALDQLLDQAAEVLHGIARLRDAARKLPEGAAFEAEVDRLRRTTRELHGHVMNARLTPFSALTERLPRAVRDLAHKLGKEVDLEVTGAEVELDRTVIEVLGDPLTHLVRNAVDHGLETPRVRLAAGKAERGKLTLHARRERDKVYVDVADDGRGLDAEKLRQSAAQRGDLPPAQAAALSDQAAYELALLPGLSTREEATEVSGRGVGLDAVKGAIEALGGKLAIRSTPGKGASFTLELPLSVSMANLLLVHVGGELYGLPLHRVVSTIEYDLSARGGEGFEARSLAVMGQLVRAFSLAKLFGLPSLAPPGPRPFAVMEVDGVTFAVSVDRLVGQEEAVLRPLYPPLDRIKGLAGTTVLGNGRPLLVLDPRGLAELAFGPSQRAAPVKGAA